MVKALLAAEDARFYDHGGIDLIRIGGAALRDIATRRMSQGASTLTQQLARAGLPVAREDDRAEGERGVPDRRDRAPVLEGPDPHDVPEPDPVRARQLRRRGRVPLVLRPRRPDAHAARGGAPRRDHPAARGLLPRAEPGRREGAPRLRPPPDARRGLHLARRSARPRRRRRSRSRRATRESTVGPYFCEEVRQYLEKQYGETELYREGLRVDSTLDPRLQRWAEDALRWGLRRQDRRAGFRKPRNLVAEGLDPETWKDPSWSDGSAARPTTS